MRLGRRGENSGLGKEPRQRLFVTMVGALEGREEGSQKDVMACFGTYIS